MRNLKLRRASSKTASVFVKTSCRSPKDAPTSQAKLLSVYETLVAQDEDKSENARLAHLLRAGLEVMRVREAKEAMALLTRSRRIWQDMTLAVENSERWNQHIIVRAWQDMDVDMEFRCFVRNGSLVAISQYNSLCYFPRVVQQQRDLKATLTSFFYTHLRHRLAPKFSDYVVDLAVVGSGEAEAVKVIELNPFLDSTDAACFSWVSDRALLEGAHVQASACTCAAQAGACACAGRGCEMRVTEAAMAGARAALEDTWRATLEAAPLSAPSPAPSLHTAPQLPPPRARAGGRGGLA